MAASSAKRGNSSPFSHTDREIVAVADGQHEMIARRQLFELGLDRDEIAYRRRVGRLHPKFHGVYTLGTPAVTPDGWRMGAVLAGGDDAVLFARSSLALFQIGPDISTGWQIACPRQVRRPKITASCVEIPPDEITEVRNIPTVGPNRALLEYAASLRPSNPQNAKRAINRALNEGAHLQLTDVVSFGELFERHPRHKGRRVLEMVLENRDENHTRTELEEAGLAFFKEIGAPDPLTNHRIEIRGRSHEYDYAWPDLKVLGEADSRTFHGRTTDAFETDRALDTAAQADGWTTIRITWRRLHRDRNRFAAEVLDIFTRRE